MGDDAIRRYARRLRLAVIAVFGVVLAFILCGHFGLRVGRAHRAPAVDDRSRTLGDIRHRRHRITAHRDRRLLVERGIARGRGRRAFFRCVVRRFGLFAFWMLIAALFNTFAPMVLAAPALAASADHRIMILSMFATCC